MLWVNVSQMLDNKNIIQKVKLKDGWNIKFLIFNFFKMNSWKIKGKKFITLASLCQDPASPGGPNPTKASFAGPFCFDMYLQHLYR